MLLFESLRSIDFWLFRFIILSIAIKWRISLFRELRCRNETSIPEASNRLWYDLRRRIETCCFFRSRDLVIFDLISISWIQERLWSVSTFSDPSVTLFGRRSSHEIHDLLLRVVDVLEAGHLFSDNLLLLLKRLILHGKSPHLVLDLGDLVWGFGKSLESIIQWLQLFLKWKIGWIDCRSFCFVLGEGILSLMEDWRLFSLEIQELAEFLARLFDCRELGFGLWCSVQEAESGDRVEDGLDVELTELSLLLELAES